MLRHKPESGEGPLSKNWTKPFSPKLYKQSLSSGLAAYYNNVVAVDE